MGHESKAGWNCGGSKVTKVGTFYSTLLFVFLHKNEKDVGNSKSERRGLDFWTWTWTLVGIPAPSSGVGLENGSE